MKNVQALVFDLDDTLIDARAAYRRALVQAGVDPDGDEFKEARAAVKRGLPDGHVAARNRLLYFKALLEARGTLAAASLLELMHRYEAALGADLRAQWEALGRQALFERLSARYRLAILTNENARTQLLKLAAIDPLGKLFSVVVTSEEVGQEKPHPKMFEAALARIALPKDACVAIGNDLEHDIRAARSLGLRAVWTREFEPGPAPQGDVGLSIDALPELEGLLS